ncbi:MAG: RNA polymerase sigma factor RpoH [Rickettsiales bacterium]|jgi:RNA polymerase sigma-32 factor|nr:RNA polymerase sigma factor RpoH [Rickettsiales bacterium]
MKKQNPSAVGFDEKLTEDIETFTGIDTDLTPDNLDDDFDISDSKNVDDIGDNIPVDYKASYIPAIRGKNDLAYFLNEVNKYPMLTEAEEKALALRYYNDGDLDAAHTLVTSHLRMVVKIAYQYRGYGLPVADMISEGSIGLMRAVKKFDPNKGFRFSTYALWWVKAQINEFVLNSWSMVKIGTTAAQKKLFFNLRKLKDKLNIFSGRDLTDDETQLIADNLGVKSNEVRDMNLRLSHSSDFSLNNKVGFDDGDGLEHGDNLASEDMNAEELLIKNDSENFHKRIILEALEHLTEREREIIKMRKLTDKPMLLDDLGIMFGISKERVRQIEEAALKKMQKFLQKKNVQI